MGTRSLSHIVINARGAGSGGGQTLPTVLRISARTMRDSA
jgi:hypothetical protein